MRFFVESESDLSMSKKSLWGITIVTVIYLIVELAFQSRLLDVAGTSVSIEEVEGLEKFGRLISGTALYLLVVGVVLLPMLKKHRFKHVASKVLMFGLAGFIIIGGVYHGEKKLVDHLVDSSSGIDRAVAVKAMIIQNSLLNDTIKLDGIELGPEILKSPEGKSFAAVLPFLGSTILDGKLKKEDVRTIIENEIKNEIGDGNNFLKTHVHSRLKQLDNAYQKKYVPATNEYRKATAHNVVAAKAEQAWRKYLDKLSNEKITPENIPEHKWPEVRNQVRKSGIMVSNSWKPWDKQGFLNALNLKYQKDASKKFKTEFDEKWNQYRNGLEEKRLDYGSIPERYWSRVRNEVRKKGLPVPDTWDPNDKLGFYNCYKASFKKEVTKKFEREAENHWETYKKQVANYKIGSNLKEIPESRWAQIRKEIHKSGVDVPATWKPWEKAVFIESFKPSYKAGVLKKFREETQKIVGFYPKHIVPGLSYAAFLKNRDVKRYLGSKNKYIGKSNKQVLQEIIQTKTNEQVLQFTAKPEEYGNGGKYEEIGKRAMRTVVVPPFALFFSLLGGFAHIFKVLNFILSFKIKPILRLPVMFVGTMIIVFCISNINLSNSITDSRLYNSLEERVSETYHPVVAKGINTLIETAPFSYPINDFFRNTFLFGFDFALDIGQGH
jgi:hypothetical protein